MSRYSVVGTSGTGKTTLATAIADRLAIPRVELDGLYHQPGWQPPPAHAFETAVATATAGEAWVVDGNYSMVRSIVWGRATHVVWLDYPRALVLRRVVARTLRRVVLREELWNGNREPWRNLWDPRPERNIILWSWTRHEAYRERYLAAIDDPAWAHLEFIRLRSPAETEAWLEGLTTGGSVG